MFKVNVKWGKQVLNDVELNSNEPVATFKAQLFKLTHVPVERQKLMAKGVWKGILKDDVAFNTLEKLNNGVQLMLMGSADVMKEPVQKVVFMEDMTQEEKAEAGAQLPSGLTNLGNTCYMNSTLQCLRPIEELREALSSYTGAPSGDLAHNFTLALRDSFAQMDKTTEEFSPMTFVHALRQASPQFAEMSRRGGYAQQDSEEFLSVLFSTLASKLEKPTKTLTNLGHTNNIVDALFSLQMEETLHCSESDAEMVIKKQEKALKLVCNITKDTNHVAEGIKVGLEGTIEKNSDVLGRNAVWNKTIRIVKLPKYLCVQFMRFYWKLTPDSHDHQGVKCKMLRPMSFPLVLDVYDFCSDELRATLKVARDKHADEILNEFKDGEKKEGNVDDKMDVEEQKALDEAKALSLGGTSESPGLQVPDNFMGNYELFALVTHKGRSADSGHYIGWSREKDSDNWHCFDDEDVSPCKWENIQKLKGGGDWHMNYLTFYRLKD